ncbi:hypothetical protein UP3_c0469 [Ureaplasma parvum serovar 3]|nr:hypothetical protein UP3_c0469 [Ureaplasma parvum serovar 3]
MNTSYLISSSLLIFSSFFESIFSCFAWITTFFINANNVIIFILFCAETHNKRSVLIFKNLAILCLLLLKYDLLTLSNLFKTTKWAYFWFSKYRLISTSSFVNTLISQIWKTAHKFWRYPKYWSIMAAKSVCFSLLTFANPYPGKSTNLKLLKSKKFTNCVLPGVFEVLAIFLFANALIKLDLPTFDLPITHISNCLSIGYWSK